MCVSKSASSLGRSMDRRGSAVGMAVGVAFGVPVGMVMLSETRESAGFTPFLTAE